MHENSHGRGRGEALVSDRMELGQVSFVVGSQFLDVILHIKSCREEEDYIL